MIIAWLIALTPVGCVWCFIGARLSIHFIRQHRDLLRRDVWRLALGAVLMPVMLLILAVDWLSKGNEVVCERIKP